MSQSIPPKFAAILREAASTVRRDADSGPVLLEQFVASRDEEAFRGLVHLYGPMVWAVCRRGLRDANDAEDAFQATFIVLARRAAQISSPERLPAWLHAVAVRCARKVRDTIIRRKEVQVTTLPEAAVEAPPPSTDITGILDEELDRLPTRFRLAFVLCQVEGRTHAETARILGCSERTVAYRLDRAAEVLKARLGRRGVVPAACLAVLMTQPGAGSALPGALINRAVGGALASSGEMPSTTALAVAEAVGRGMAARTTRWLVGLVLLLSAGAGIGAVVGQKPSVPPHIPPRHLGQAAPASVRLDRFGDPLPDGALARVGTVRLRPEPYYGAGAAAVAPNGQTIYSVHGRVDQGRSEVYVWDLPTGKKVRQVAAPMDTQGVALSPDGRVLVACGGGEVYAWNSADMSLLWKASLPGASACRIAVFSPNGHVLACATNAGVYLINPVGGRVERILTKPGSSRLAFAPDSRTLFVARDEATVSLWDVTTGTKIRTFGGDADTRATISSLAVSTTDGRLVVSHTDGVIRCWEVANGTEVWSTQNATPYAFIGFVAGGAELIEAGAEQIRFRDPTTGRELRPPAHAPQLVGNYPTDACGLSPDGTLLTSSTLAAVGVWNVATGQPVGPTGVPGGIVAAVAFSPDGNELAVVTGMGPDWLWLPQVYDAWTGRLRGEFRLPGGNGASTHPRLNYVPDGRVAVSWEQAADSSRYRLVGHCVVGAIRPKTLASELVRGAAGAYLAPSPDGRTVAVAGLGEARVIEAGGRTRVLRGASDLAGLTFSADGSAVAGWEVGPHPFRTRVSVWDARSGLRTGGFQAETSEVFGGLALSPDGQQVATVQRRVVDRWYGTSSVSLFDAASGGQLWNVEIPPFSGCTPVFSPDARMVAIGDRDGSVRLIETHTGRERLRRTGHRGQVLAVTFSPDGRRVASAGWDGTALVWDISPTGRVGGAPAEQWLALTRPDAVAAYQAIADLATNPAAAVPILSARLRSAPIATERDDGRFRLGIVRGIEALEWMAHDPAAASLLRELSELPAEDSVGREARAACRRLAAIRHLPVSAP